MATRVLIQPLDLSQFDQTAPTTSPGFADLVNSELGNTVTDADGFDQLVSDTLGLITALDAAGTAQDADLDSILALLETSEPSPIGGLIDNFAGVQPTGESLLGGVENIAAPSLHSVSLLQPDGAAAVVFGGAPSQGGAAQSGGAPYIYHLLLFAVGGGIHNVDAAGGSGPNPPFAAWGPVVQETGPDGNQYWAYHVAINPQTPGTYTGQAQYLVNLTITGITGTVTRTTNFQVVIEPATAGAPAQPPPVAAPPPPPPPPPPPVLPPTPPPPRVPPPLPRGGHFSPL